MYAAIWNEKCKGTSERIQKVCLRGSSYICIDCLVATCAMSTFPMLHKLLRLFVVINVVVVCFYSWHSNNIFLQILSVDCYFTVFLWFYFQQKISNENYFNTLIHFFFHRMLFQFAIVCKIEIHVLINIKRTYELTHRWGHMSENCVSVQFSAPCIARKLFWKVQAADLLIIWWICRELWNSKF